MLPNLPFTPTKSKLKDYYNIKVLGIFSPITATLAMFVLELCSITSLAWAGVRISSRYRNIHHLTATSHKQWESRGSI